MPSDMRASLRTIITVAVLAIVLSLMWAQTFAVTGVNAKAATPGAARPPAPEAPELTKLPAKKFDLARFAEETPIWSPLPY